MTLHRESHKIKVSEDEPLRFNVDCYGIDFDTYQFLLGDIAQGIEDGNRMYGFGEPGYIGTDGNFHPLTDNFIPALKQKQRPIPKSKRKKRIRSSVEQIAIARGIIKIHSQITKVSKEVSH
jgi:hypothetical protein